MIMINVIIIDFHAVQFVSLLVERQWHIESEATPQDALQHSIRIEA